ncbi:MAG: FAD-dependent oxidoreductase, partial [Mailhella sp.]|nr:FAD-dependent oxidoreductase [Mailhella sp.]
LAEQMCDTSLCGVGRTAAIPLLQAIAHFSDEMHPQTQLSEEGFYSVTTSPCIEACPSHVNVPRYIDYIKDGHNDLSAGVVLKHYPFAGSCGRVCVRYCEQACRRGKVDQPVDIRNLKRFAADKTIVAGVLHPTPFNSSKSTRVAIVGAGPVGITCAYQLLDMGYPVDIYEAHDRAGGMIRYGIPFYRLPKNVLQQENELIKSMGGMFFFNQKLGRDFHVGDLFARGYKAVFIATGCPKGSYLGMPDEDISQPGYENGIAFLERVHDMLEGGGKPTLQGDIVVVGGGNVAMDCCRTAVRMTDGKVHLVYRRTEADAPADHEEITEAMKEGVEFHFLTGQDRLIISDGKITGLQCLRMEQTDPDASGRRGVRPVAGSEFVIPCSSVLAAIGQTTDPDFLTEEDGIDCDRKKHILVDEYQATSRPGVFAGGDGTSGPRSKGPSVLIHGMAQGAIAALAIDSYLQAGTAPFLAREQASKLVTAAKLFENDEACPHEKQPRVKIHDLKPDERDHNFNEVEETMTQQEAWQEASRCMRCYRIISFVTRHRIPGVTA